MTQNIYFLKGRLIKRSCGTIILVIHSKPLTMRVLEIGQKVSLTKFRNGLIIEPNGSIHATIAAKKRLQIAITKLIKEGLFNIEKIPMTVSVYVNLNTWKLTELLKQAIGSPLTTSIPKNLVTKKAAIKKSHDRFYIDFSFKKLSDIARNKCIRCLFMRDGKGFVIIRSNSLRARKLTSHSKRRVQISIPRKMLTKKELRYLSRKNWLVTWLKFDVFSFGLDITDFYNVQEEKELVKSLIDKGMKIGPKNYRDPYDIYLEDYNSCIEVHNSKPDTQDFGSRHRIRTGQVRLRILEAQQLIDKLNLRHMFVIVNSLWYKNKYVMDLAKSDKKVHVLFTNFRDNWAAKITQKILDMEGSNIRKPQDYSF